MKIKSNSVNQSVMQFRGAALTLLVLTVSACDWVDSTGIQTGDPVDATIALIEETQKNIEFSVPVSDANGESRVQSWNQVDEGALGCLLQPD